MSRYRERWFYILILPWIVGFLLFYFGPILSAFLLSFAEWPLPNPPRWNGIDHFLNLFNDSIFHKALLNTAIYALGTVPLGVMLGLLLALLLNNKRRGTTLFRLVVFMPVVISGVATTLMWGWIFNPRYGPLNNILIYLGVHAPAWLEDESWAMPALIFISLWNVGVNMLLYLVALQNVSVELIEAASLDGANRWQKFWHITWHLISPVTFYLIIVNIIAALQTFTPTYILTRGGPNNATLTLPLYIYQNAFSWGRLGYASTLAFMLFLITLILTLIQFNFSKRWVFYSGRT